MKYWWYRFYYTTRGILWPLWIGLVNLFRRPVTIQYPHEKPRLFPRSRMMLYNDIDNCIGCLQCARVCPVDCIAIETVKADKDLGVTNTGHKKKLYVTIFDIDEAKCCYCNLCTEVCPTECLVMTPNFEGSVYDRYDLVLRFAKITPEERAEILRKAGGKTAGVTGILARKT